MTRPTRRRLALLVVALGATAGGYAYFRPTPIPPPAVDLSRAEPEVAAAVTDALAGVTRAPRAAAAWGDLGMVLRAHDLEADSDQAFAEAERLDPADWRWPYLRGLTLALTDPDGGLAALTRAADRAPPDRPEAALRLADLLLDRGRAAEAETRARAVAGRDPANARAALVLARAAADRGDWAAVLAAAGPHADNPVCQKRVAALCGAAYQRAGDPERAARELARAAAFPDDPWWPDRLVDEVNRKAVGTSARMRAAGRLLAAGRADDAAAALREVVRRAPDRADDARLLLGRSLIEAGNPAAARDELRELTTRAPGSVEGWFHRGVAEYQTGDPGAAAESFARAVALKPDHALAHFNLGHTRKQLGNRAGAAAAYEAALRCRPDHEPSRVALRELAAGK